MIKPRKIDAKETGFEKRLQNSGVFLTHIAIQRIFPEVPVVDIGHFPKKILCLDFLPEFLDVALGVH